MTEVIGLEVNGVTIKLDHFVQAFVEQTVSGMLESLDNTEPISELSLIVDSETVNIMLNGKTVNTNEFVNTIIKSTLSGMVFPLKGVKAKRVNEINSLRIEITR